MTPPTSGIADILGAAVTGPAKHIPAPLEDSIFETTSAALRDAGLGLGEIDGVYTATSDVFDGRAISTMTLTASTGSFRKHEMKVCDDGLVAVALGADGLRSGVVERALISSWSKFSEGDLATIDNWTVEPAFHRPLGLNTATVAALQRSAAEAKVVVVDRPIRGGGDVTVSLVLGKAGVESNPQATLLGAGWSAGPYLQPSTPALAPLADAAHRALRDGRFDPDRCLAIHCGGFFDTSDDELRAATGLSVEVVRTDQRDLELGYATGLLALAHAANQPGPRLVISRSGIGTARAGAVIVEGHA